MEILKNPSKINGESNRIIIDLEEILRGVANKEKAILQEVATNKHVQQRVPFAEKQMDYSVESSNELPKNASTSSDKEAQLLRRSNMILRAALAEVTAKLNQQISELKATAYKDKKKPIFSSSELEHPLNFLEGLQNYFAELPMERQTIDTVIDCLEGPANEWALIMKDQWSNIEDIKKDFIEQYWGMSSQNALRVKIINGSYNDEEGAMNSYFLSIISQAKWLPRKISDDELVSDIMHHFPRHVQIAWYHSQKRTVHEAVEFLKKMDEIEIVCSLKEETQIEYQKANDRMHAYSSEDDFTRKDGFDHTECCKSADYRYCARFLYDS